MNNFKSNRLIRLAKNSRLENLVAKTPKIRIQSWSRVLRENFVVKLIKKSKRKSIKRHPWLSYETKIRFMSEDHGFKDQLGRGWPGHWNSNRDRS